MTALIVIVGPTASGKSELAIQIAQKLNQPAEIVNCDSMLVYRGMDIGTAKPTVSERQLVPHHLIDVMNVSETATVADFQYLARKAIEEIRSRLAVPILVGGSSLYIRAVIDDFDFPGTDPVLRARLQEELDREGSQKLHERLAGISPEAAMQILPGNGRRIVRALEIYELTGQIRPYLPKHVYALDDVHQFGLLLDRQDLDRRIEQRVELMWQQGLVDEVKQLVDAGLRQGLTASRGLGYQQVLSFLAGEISEEEAKQQTKDGTRRFSRKQLGWFRKDPRISWLAAGDETNAQQIIADIGLDCVNSAEN